MFSGCGAQGVGRCGRVIQCFEKSAMIDRMQPGAFVRLYRDQSGLIGGTHRKGGIIHACQRRSLADRVLDARLGAKAHPRRAKLINYVAIILEAQSKSLPSYP